jgi:hypothetical protein
MTPLRVHFCRTLMSSPSLPIAENYREQRGGLYARRRAPSSGGFLAPATPRKAGWGRLAAKGKGEGGNRLWLARARATGDASRALSVDTSQNVISL